MRLASWFGHGLVAVALSCTQAQAATAERVGTGAAGDGAPIEAITLTAPNGVTARLIGFGATLQSFTLPDRKGMQADVVHGHDTAVE